MGLSETDKKNSKQHVETTPISPIFPVFASIQRNTENPAEGVGINP